MEHGTVEMYRKELRLHKKGEGPEPCTLCKKAQADYIWEYRLDKTRDRRAETQRATIRRRALNRLAEEFPGAYERLLAEETRQASGSVRVKRPRKS